MATTFGTVTDFMLILFDPNKVDGGTRPPGSTRDANEGYTWQRLEYIATIERYGTVLDTFTPITLATLSLSRMHIPAWTFLSPT